jgi:hypothetical protein
VVNFWFYWGRLRFLGRKLLDFESRNRDFWLQKRGKNVVNRVVIVVISLVVIAGFSS